jgi:hypothetical protein
LGPRKFSEVTAPEANKVKTSGTIVAVICIVLFCGATTQPAAAQNEAPRTFSSLQPWNPADETTFAAAIQEIVSKNAPGAPAGLNLLMTGSKQALYVNVGPHLGGPIERLLSAGQVIQVVGIVRVFNGQNYLLARELQIGDRKIQVRNQHGFFTYPSASTGPSSVRPETSKFGGAR